MRIVVLDVETVGLAVPEGGGGVVELAASSLDWSGTSLEWISDFSTLVNPGVSVPPEASAVHHLVDSDLLDAPTLDSAVESLLTHGEPDIVFAQNSSFDKKFLPQLHGYEWGCTLKAARALVPGSPSYGLQVLRYYLGLQPQLDGVGHTPHRAAYDVRCTVALLSHLLGLGYTPQELAEYRGRPSLIRKIPFGKHRGQAWSEVPRNYVEWVVRAQPPFDDDVVFSAREFLAGRLS